MNSLLRLHLAIAWLWIIVGFASGAFMGMRFHQEDWLGGYGSHRRRLYRLGHISFFGLAIMNLLFVFTVQQLGGSPGMQPALVRIASAAFVIGAVTMPCCCAVAAHKPDVRLLFAIPVTSLLAGGVCTFLEVINL
jgi:hypothetical protein